MRFAASGDRGRKSAQRGQDMALCACNGKALGLIQAFRWSRDIVIRIGSVELHRRFRYQLSCQWYRLVRTCGIVTLRQQPQTAAGVVFVTLEDESGSVNVIVWKTVKARFRDALYRARLLAVYGVWQRDDDSGGEVRHVVASRLVDMTHLLGDIAIGSRDFH